MKLKNLLYITGTAALLTACSADYLDTLPQSSTDSGTVFETTENARMAVNGLCLMMTQQYLNKQGVNGEGTVKTWYGNYVKTLFRVLNNRLYSGTMSDKDQPMVDRITSALKKFPTFDGKTYRNLSFQDEPSFNSYLSEFAQGETVTLKAFTSTSKRPNGYPKFGDYVVHMVIEGTSGADIADTYGIPRQQEVIFLPGTQLFAVLLLPVVLLLQTDRQCQPHCGQYRQGCRTGN